MISINFPFPYYSKSIRSFTSCAMLVVIVSLISFPFYQVKANSSKSADSPITVSIVNAPIFLCPGDQATLGVNTNNIHALVLWSTGATSAQIQVNQAGTYSVTVTDPANGCTATDVVTIEAGPVPPIPTITALTNPNVCEGGTVILRSSAKTGNVWTGLVNSRTLTVSTSGAYTVRVSNGICISENSAPFQVIFNIKPTTPTVSQIQSQGDNCSGSFPILASNAPANTTNLWSNGATSSEIFANKSGQYTVQAISNGCTSAVSNLFSVSANSNQAPPTISASGPVKFCKGGSVVLTSSQQFGNIWSTGEGTRSITVTKSGTYSVQKFTGNGPCEACTCFTRTSIPVVVEVEGFQTTSDLIVNANSTNPSHTGCSDGTLTGSFSTNLCWGNALVEVFRIVDGEEANSVDQIQVVHPTTSFSFSDLPEDNYQVKVTTNTDMVGNSITHALTPPPPCQGNAISVQIASGSLGVGCSRDAIVNLTSLDCFESWRGVVKKGNLLIDEILALKGRPAFFTVPGDSLPNPNAQYKIEILYQYGPDLFEDTCIVSKNFTVSQGGCNGAIQVNTISSASSPCKKDGKIQIRFSTTACMDEYSLYIRKAGSIAVQPNISFHDWNCGQGQDEIIVDTLGIGSYVVGVSYLGQICPGFESAPFTIFNFTPVETCNGEDDDCDGQIDEGCPPAPSPLLSAPSGTFQNPTPVSITIPPARVKVRPGVTSIPTIYFTLDGTTPIKGSPLTKIYTGPILIAQTSNLKARVYQDGFQPSSVISAFYTVLNPTVLSAPQISPGTGTYNGTQLVTLSSSISGVQFYYTLTGNNPVIGTSHTLLYTGSFQVLQSGTVKAIAVKTGTADSPISSAFYSILEPGVVSKPEITPGTGTYANAQSVSISCATPGAQIFYTTNGNIPIVGTSFTIPYSTPFQQNTNGTIRAIGVKTGLEKSPIAVAFFTINSPTPTAGAPIMSPGPGLYSGPQSITLTTSTAGAQIFYTTNGNEPRFDVPNGFTKLYSVPFSVTTTSTVRAIAKKTDFLNSPTAVGVYTIGAARKAVTSLQEEVVQSGDILIFPNPSSDGLFHILLPENQTEIAEYILLGVSGKTIETRTLKPGVPHIVDLSRHPMGLYNLKIRIGDRFEIRRLSRI